MKPVSNWDEYAEMAEWCNNHNSIIVEREDCYEVVAVPEPTFAELKERKLAELSASFNARVAGSFVTSQGFEMQFDRSDSLAVEGMIKLMEATGETVGYLTQANDLTVYGVSLDTIKDVLVQMLKMYARCHAKKQEYRTWINACETKEGLDGIEFVWPVSAE